MKLSEQIYTLRIARNMSQGDLADALEVSRQSVSKWETGAAVPDLDKLLRMSELFGVTLDTLVRGESAAVQVEPQPEPAMPQATVAPPQDISQTQRILGFCLLGFSALTWLLVTLLGDFLAGVCLALPFLTCGIICLRVRRHAWLFCCWAVFFMVQAFLHFATSTSIFSLFTFIHMVTEGFHWGILITFILGILFLGLLAATLYTYRAQLLPTSRKNIVRLCIMVGVIFVLHTLFPLIISPIYGAYFYDQLPYLWLELLMALRYLLHYAEQIVLILTLLRAAAMIRYHRKK